MSGFHRYASQYPHLNYLLKPPVPVLATEFPFPPIVTPLMPTLRPTYRSFQTADRPPLYPIMQQNIKNLPNPFLYPDFRPIPLHSQAVRLMRGHAPIIHPVRLVDGALTLNDVIDILRHCIYSGTKQDVNCPVCGKKYKSKVCLTKHLWEHSVYWSQFNGMKNHERVLCIQTALILTKNPFSSILVTAPFRKKTKDKNPETVKRANEIRKSNISKTNDNGGENQTRKENKTEQSTVNEYPDLKAAGAKTATEQENQRRSVQDFLHFTDSLNTAAAQQSEPKCSSPKIRRRRQSLWKSEQTQEKLDQTVTDPKQEWFKTAVTQSSKETLVHTSTVNNSSQYTGLEPTFATEQSFTEVSPNNNHSRGGDSGADDSGYGTSEHKMNGERNVETNEEQHKNATATIMESNNNKRLADFLEEHQGRPIESADSRKVRKFDMDSNGSSSSCQPHSRGSSCGDGGRMSTDSLESRESEQSHR